MIDNNELKKELQGNGPIKSLRNKYIPTTLTMAHLAQEKYMALGLGFSDIDLALEKLLEIEYDIYKSKKVEYELIVIEYLDSEANATNYPKTRMLLDLYKKQGESPLKAALSLTPIIHVLSESLRQAEKTRAGSSLMNHIAFLLEKRGFVYQQHFEREFYINPENPSSKLDFFFPSREMFNHEPKNCCAASCQTTSNDRYRLTFAQAPKDTRNRACTAIGSKNFGDKLGAKSLTTNKLKDARDKGIKFVVLNACMDNRLRQSHAVITYEQWFEELEKLRTFWN